MRASSVRLSLAPITKAVQQPRAKGAAEQGYNGATVQHEEPRLALETRGDFTIPSPAAAAVKRLMREAMELREPTFMYFAQPLEVRAAPLPHPSPSICLSLLGFFLIQDNLFEWHFTIRGPEGTEFEGGFYHGRIILPSEYPMKPPSIILMTVSKILAQWGLMEELVLVQCF